MFDWTTYSNMTFLQINVDTILFSNRQFDSFFIQPTLWFIWHAHIQLFRRRLSHKSVQAYATMLIGIMGRKSLALIDWGSRCWPTRKGINSCLSCFPQCHWNTQSINQGPWIPITYNAIRHCRVRFCWTTFLETAVHNSLTHRSHSHCNP